MLVAPTPGTDSDRKAFEDGMLECRRLRRPAADASSAALEVVELAMKSDFPVANLAGPQAVPGNTFAASIRQAVGVVILINGHAFVIGRPEMLQNPVRLCTGEIPGTNKLREYGANRIQEVKKRASIAGGLRPRSPSRFQRCIVGQTRARTKRHDCAAPVAMRALRPRPVTPSSRPASH